MQKPKPTPQQQRQMHRDYNLVLLGLLPLVIIATVLGACAISALAPHVWQQIDQLHPRTAMALSGTLVVATLLLAIRRKR